MEGSPAGSDPRSDWGLPDSEGTSGPEAGQAELWGYWEVLRRRWWLVVAFGALGAAFVWWQSRNEVPFYTADVLLETRREATSMGGLAMPSVSDQAVAAEFASREIESQRELLNSRAVTGPVVEELSLRLVVLEPRILRSSLFSEATIGPNARLGVYVVEQTDDQVLLRDGSSDQILATAATGTLLEGPGFSLLHTPGAAPGERVPILIQSGDDAVETLRGARLQLETTSGSRLMRVRFSSPDPELAALVVNAVSRSFRDYSVRQARESATRRREVLSGQLVQVSDSLSKAQESLLEYQESEQLLDPGTEAEAIATELVRVEGELRTRRFEKSVLENLLASLRLEAEADDGFRRMLALGSEVFPAAGQLYTRLRELQLERDRLTTSRIGYTDQAPTVEQLDSLISATQQETREVTQQSVSLLESRISTSEIRVSQLQGQVSELPAKTAEYVRLGRRLEGVQRIFDVLLERQYEAQVDEVVESGRVEIVDEALIPSSPDRTNTRRNMVLAIILGMAAGMTGTFALDRMDTKIRDILDVRQASGLDVLALIPNLQAKRRLRRGSGSSRPILAQSAKGERGHLGLEAFQSLRTSLQFTMKNRKHGFVVVVSSASPGEGKSTVASNLALRMSYEGKACLLLDGDLRHPSVHRAFGLEASPGLTDVIRGSVTLQDAVHTVDDSELRVLPAGIRATTSGRTRT